MKANSSRNVAAAEPSPFEPHTRQPAAPAVIAQAAPPSGLPEIDQAEDRLKVEKERLDSATARQDAVLQAVSAARNQSNLAIRKRAAETDLLTVARREFGLALSAGGDTTDIQRRVTDAQMKIDALTNLSESALAEAKQAERMLEQHQTMVGNARKSFEQAELMVLIKQYAQALVPCIPLAREISRRAGHMNHDLRGYLIDVRRPKVGNYTIRDDGTMHFQLG
jgi:hypothetical protein